MSTNRTRASVESVFAAAAGALVRCEYCGREVFLEAARTDPARAVGDHRTPLARGGKDTRKNIAVVCHTCDRRKGPLTVDEFQRVRKNDQELARQRRIVLSALQGGTPLYVGRVERADQRRQRRQERLASRLQAPDPSCAVCMGTGEYMPRRGRSLLPVICVCAIRDPKGRPGQPILDTVDQQAAFAAANLTSGVPVPLWERA